MVSVYQLIQLLVIAVLYLSILPIQLVIFPSSYYSVREVIYNKDLDKATKSSVSRFLLILILSYIARLFKFENWVIISGIALGSFLCVWPSIYQYRLYCFFDHSIKFLYFCSSILSVFFSIVCAWISIYSVIPSVFYGENIFLLDNSGISLIGQAIGICIPFSMRKILEQKEADNPYMDGITFSADLCMTYRKMKFEKNFLRDYHIELSQAAEKYDIDLDLLNTVIVLERINRKSWYRRKIEYLACRFFPSYVIRHNSSLDLAQISVNTAKSFYKKSPRRYLLDMLKDENSIELCAYYLKELLEQYSKRHYSRHTMGDEFNTDELPAKDKLGLFIASQYICGCNTSLRKFSLVYMTVIAQSLSEDYIPEEERSVG